jgi:hypothetical protein
MSSDPILNYDQMSKKDKKDMLQDRNEYMRAHRRFQRILTSGEWVSSHRDINVFNGDTITSFEKTEGNNYKFSKSGATQVSALNSYVLSDSDPKVYTVSWIGQINPYKLTFILRDPKQPDREAHGTYFPKTDTMQLLINGPAGPIAQPDAEPAWGITTNYYTHIV